MAAFRLLVGDVERALRFYRDLLGFEVVEQWGPAIAILSYDGAQVWLSGPQTSAAQPMPDGTKPVPGGWNRIVVQVPDLEAEVGRLQAAGARFRNEVITGPGGKQVLVEDGEGNVVELFQSR
jgi:catechol 2,3-dioxygenase-like lactoylglutathione lyase family enzyme